MFSHKEALDLSTNIIWEIEKGKKIAELLPEILRLSIIIKDKEFEEICELELSGYNITPEIDQEKLDHYGIKVGRIKFENKDGILERVHFLTPSLKALEDEILNYKGSKDWKKIGRISNIMMAKDPVEAFFIKKINDIHKELKEYYPQKIIDDYLKNIIEKLGSLDQSLLDKIENIYDCLYSTKTASLSIVPDLARKILVELGNLTFQKIPEEKTEISEGKRIYLLTNGDPVEIKENDRNFKNKLIAFIDYSISSDSVKINILTELELLGNNIIKFSDLVTKYSHIEEKNRHSITSIAIRLIVVIGDIINFYK